MARKDENERARTRAANTAVEGLASEPQQNAAGQAESPQEALAVPEDRQQALEQIRAAVARRRMALDALATL